ncbi:SixA phosphatase family protein [Montanilutibacter psychrotolerans]|nr:phosphoglycerate mutase family protein [Lysobacter psychrotolerans]
MHRLLSLLCVATLALALGACGLPTRPSAPAVAQVPHIEFLVVRHAEKASDDPRDPSLSAAGEQRAQALAKLLWESPLDAAYATQYRRTQQTAAPSARQHGVDVQAYDAGEPAATFAARLRKLHRSGRVLVVAHSNTAPDIAAALCGCEVAPIAEDQFGRQIWVRFDASGTATLDDNHR